MSEEEHSQDHIAPEATPPDQPVTWSTGGSHQRFGPRAAPHHWARWPWPGHRRAQLVALCLVASLVGGSLGAYGVVHYAEDNASSGTPAKQQLVVQESSAVIDVAKKVSPSVVSITSQSVTQGFFGQAVQESSAGTGIIVSSDGLILTNKHVVPDDTSTYTVITADGKQYASAKVVARDPINDIAFVRITATGLPAASIGDSSAVQVGQQVVAIGNALGQFQNTVTEGIISGVGRPITASDSSDTTNSEPLSNLFQTDAAINPGNSGGPLLNLAGQVIGINTAVAGQNSQNIGFAIPINEAAPLIASVQSKGVIIRPYLGVHYVQLTSDIARANKLKVSAGAWIQGDSQNPAVVSGSPADKAGLKSGDIVTKVAGTSVTDTSSLQSLIAGHSVGDKVALTVVRGSKTITITVTLGQAPAGS